MNRHDLIRISKTVSHALRHAPWLYELELDDDGWTSSLDLLHALQHHRTQWQTLTIDDLVEMVRISDKQRFEMEGSRIRARYGHSLAEKLKRRPASPPDILYHGTGEAALEVILRVGLKPMRRQYVHLSVDEDTARQVGDRKTGKTHVLTIHAREAHDAGVPFYEGNTIVWLADHVPP